MKSLRLVWAAAWRAQAMHLGLFVAVPALAALMHAAMGVVLLPFLLLRVAIFQYCVSAKGMVAMQL